MNLENNNFSDVFVLVSLLRFTRFELRNNRVNVKFGRVSFFSKFKYFDLSGNYILLFSVFVFGLCLSF